MVNFKHKKIVLFFILKSLLTVKMLARRLFTSIRHYGSLSQSGWNSKLVVAPPDPIMGLNEVFQRDNHPKKVNLTVGAYRDEKGQPFVLESVREAVGRIAADSNYNHEYSPITGNPEFIQNSQKLIFGNIFGTFSCAQTVSGTGALRVAGEFINRFHFNKKIYLPSPSWANHTKVFSDSHLEIGHYSYLKQTDTILGLKVPLINEEAMLDDIFNLENGSIILMHACAHNPSGTDPSNETWEKLVKIFRNKNHIALFDCAYQGFCSGDLEKDARTVRMFHRNDIPLIVAQSYSKNFGLYGERLGCLTFTLGSQTDKEIVDSQLKALIRPLYSNPPIQGAHIVNYILKEPDLKSKWLQECASMSFRMIKMRHLLQENLIRVMDVDLNPYFFDYITEQKGMFCFTGLQPKHVDHLREVYHIYMTQDGRISITGINEDNVKYIADSITRTIYDNL